MQPQIPQFIPQQKKKRDYFSPLLGAAGLGLMGYGGYKLTGGHPIDWMQNRIKSISNELSKTRAINSANALDVVKPQGLKDDEGNWINRNTASGMDASIDKNTPKISPNQEGLTAAADSISSEALTGMLPTSVIARTLEGVTQTPIAPKWLGGKSAIPDMLSAPWRWLGNKTPGLSRYFNSEKAIPAAAKWRTAGNVLGSAYNVSSAMSLANQPDISEALGPRTANTLGLALGGLESAIPSGRFFGGMVNDTVRGAADRFITAPTTAKASNAGYADATMNLLGKGYQASRKGDANAGSILNRWMQQHSQSKGDIAEYSQSPALVSLIKRLHTEGYGQPVKQ